MNYLDAENFLPLNGEIELEHVYSMVDTRQSTNGMLFSFTITIDVTHISSLLYYTYVSATRLKRLESHQINP